jgi:hypothetical protein
MLFDKAAHNILGVRLAHPAHRESADGLGCDGDFIAWVTVAQRLRQAFHQECHIVVDTLQTEGEQELLSYRCVSFDLQSLAREPPTAGGLAERKGGGDADLHVWIRREGAQSVDGGRRAQAPQCDRGARPDLVIRVVCEGYQVRWCCPGRFKTDNVRLDLNG